MPKGYTVPIVDIDQEERQVVVDRRDGVYLGHVTTTLLEDSSTILATYPVGHGRGPIQYKKSLDGGLTWSDTLPTPKSWATSQEVPTLFRMTDPQGKERIILFSGLYPVRRAYSEDNGETWTELEKVGDWGGIVVMGCAIKLKDGRYMALFHDDGRFYEGNGNVTNFKVYKTYTEDGGLTWSFPEAIIDVDWADHCEPGIFRSPDGHQLLVLLRENSRKYNSHFITSNDEGETWSALKEMPGALTGDRHTGRYGPDGRLFISFRDRGIKYPKTPTWGDWVGWIGTYDDIINGREGQYRLRIKDNKKSADCAYPGVEILPDGTIITTTYGHWISGEEPFIVSSRFTFDEIDTLATGFGRGHGSINHDYELYQNFPNPFNPKTVIQYNLPVASHANLCIYDIAGQKMATLVSGNQRAGFHSIEWDASQFASGVYFYRLSSEAGSLKTRKLVILK
jgi:hypothetical protein